MFDLVTFARELIDIDSTTGQEAAAGAWLASQLREMGYTVTEQPLARGCANIIATLDPPVVVLSTHFDCVPPFFPSRVEGGKLYGRGACDAKGILAAQVAASERLRRRDERRVGLLFVVGEERGSDGAEAANRIPPGSRFLINGEPTDSTVASATRCDCGSRLRGARHIRRRPSGVNRQSTSSSTPSSACARCRCRSIRSSGARFIA
jgi:acetylornithine deacetylase